MVTAPVTMTSIFWLSLRCCLLLIPTPASAWLSVPVIERTLARGLPVLLSGPSPSRLILQQSASGADADKDASTFSNALVYYYHTLPATSKEEDFPFLVSAATDPLCVQQAAAETWRWCAHFVVAHNLCPWAAKSVQTDQAIRIYVVDNIEDMEETLPIVSERFFADLKSTSIDPNAAIAFVVLADSNLSFDDYYDWYLQEEDNWLDDGGEDEKHLANSVTWAPFHPGYQFQGDDECLHVEKRSPYPTVSIVSSAVIDSAGPSVTAQIAKNNEEILRKKTASQWQELYDASVRPKPDSL
jgi:hypothetical protein